MIFFKLDIFLQADLSPMPSPDFDAPSPISDDDTDDFKFEFSRQVFDDF